MTSGEGFRPHVAFDRSNARVVSLGGACEPTEAERDAVLDIAEEAFGNAVLKAGGAVSVRNLRLVDPQ